MFAKSSLLIVNRQQAHCGNCKTFGPSLAETPEGEYLGAPECGCEWLGWTSLDFDTNGYGQEYYGVTPDRNGQGVGIVHMPWVPRTEVDWTA